MKKFKFRLLAGLLLMSLSISAGNSPAKAQNTFKKMYPQVTDAGWLRKSAYHIAEFTWNDHEMCAWFDDNGKWIMTPSPKYPPSSLLILKNITRTKSISYSMPPTVASCKLTT